MTPDELHSRRRAITDLDPQTIKEACPACLNPIYECICGGAS